MASDGADHLLESLYLAWLVNLGTFYDPTGGDAIVADNRRELQRAAFDDALGRTISALWHYRSMIVDQDVPTPTRKVGFSPACRALWCRSGELLGIVHETERGTSPPKKHLTKKAFDLFRERRPFSRMSAHLAEALKSLPCTIELGKDAHVLPELIAKAAPKLERDTLTTVVIPGIPIAGILDATIWIGFRTDEEIRSALDKVAPESARGSLSKVLRDELSQGLRAAILTLGIKEEEPRGDTMPIPHRGSADAKPAARIEINDNTRFSVVSPGDDLLLQRLLLPSWTIETRDWFRKRACATAAVVTEEIANRFRSEIDYAARNLYDPDDICYEHLLKLDDELQNRLPHDGLPFPVVPEAISLNAAVGYDDEHPARWARRFYGRVVREIVSMYDAAFFPVDPDIYPAWLYGPLEVQPSNVILLAGAAGSGRSTLLYQRLRRRHEGASFIVVGGRTRWQRTILVTSDELRRIAELVRGNGRWVIAVEGLELEKGMPPAMTTLAQLIDLAHQCTAQTGTPRVTIEAVMPSVPDSAFQQSYDGIRAPRIELDVVDPQFRRKLVNLWIKEYGISISEEVARYLQSGFCRKQSPDGKRSAVGVWTVGAMLERLRYVQRRNVRSTTARDILGESYEDTSGSVI